MIKKLFLLITILFITETGFSAIGDWKVYPSYHNATYCQVMGEKVYVLASGALFSYSKSDNEIYTYDKINSLSDIDITHIAYCKDIDALVIVYKNANIDILYKNDEVYNISDFKNKTLPDKTINNINVQGKKVYLSTSFGVVVIDLENLEFENTYNTGDNTYCTYLFGNKLYTGNKSGILCCDTTKNMLDRNNWELVYKKYPINSICSLNGKLYCQISNLGIYTFDIDKNTLKLVIANNGEKYKSIYNSQSEIIAYAPGKTTIIRDENDVVTYKNNGSNHIIKDGEFFLDCKGYNGLLECKADGDTIIAVSSNILPNSPIRNYCEFMKFVDDDKLLVAGGNLNFFGTTFYEGTLMEYHYKDNEWVNLPEEIIKETTGLKYENLCSIDEDPTEKGHYFAGSFGYGIYEFRNGEFVKHYNHLNSPLESVLPNSQTSYKYVRIPMVKFDSDGNLWCINTQVRDIVKILKKDGTWVSLYYKDIENLPTMVNPIIDSRGWLWITSLQGEAGLFCAKTNNTYFDTSDDITKVWLNKFKNQDGTTYDIYQVYGLCEDKKGDIWIGTNSGLFIVDDFNNLFNNNIFKQIKVPRNDGTGLADYLLSGVYIKAITVDGANRKWIGTNDNGIYLVSPNGLETIHHFTTENSPLPSNTIESIAVNDYTGEVFIGTDKGMASYMSDATKPSESLDENNIHAYPNPVKADYNGNIFIIGLTNECNVKIVDVAGYLINEGTSIGGQYSWDGRNAKGEKVPSGVYYVLTYDENGNEGATTKILMTR